MPLPPYLYTYDPVGTSVANKRTNELHNVAPPNNPLNANFIVPRAAPFFKVGLIVRTGAAINDPVLEEGVDYILTHPFIEASLVLNKLIYGSIMFLDRQYSGDIYLTYQTLGGGYTLDDYDIVESLTNSLYNIRLVSWTQIEGLPLSYPGIPHVHGSYADMVGLSEVVDQLTQLVATVTASGGNLNSLITSFQQHLINPISHDKSQVGLSLVPNYPAATSDDVSALSDTALMTPKKTINMLKDYSELLSDDTKVTKDVSVTGGGLATGGGTLSADRIIRVNVATPADVRAGESDLVALTPKTGALLVERHKEQINLPLDDQSEEILDIDAIVYPGVYRLSHTRLFSNGNYQKLPKQIYDGYGYIRGFYTPPPEAPWERFFYKLTVRKVDVAIGWVEQVLSRNIDSPNYEELSHDVIYRRVGTTGTWGHWHKISGFTNILASYYCDNLFGSLETTWGNNCRCDTGQGPLDALQTAAGVTLTSGNYTTEQLLAMYTVRFSDSPAYDEYAVHITCTPVYSSVEYSTGQSNTSSSDPGGKGQVITLHTRMIARTFDGFTFMVEDVRLGNDGVIRRNPAWNSGFNVSVIVLGLTCKATLNP